MARHYRQPPSGFVTPDHDEGEAAHIDAEEYIPLWPVALLAVVAAGALVAFWPMA